MADSRKPLITTKGHSEINNSDYLFKPTAATAAATITEINNLKQSPIYLGMEATLQLLRDEIGSLNRQLRVMNAECHRLQTENRQIDTSIAKIIPQYDAQVANLTNTVRQLSIELKKAKAANQALSDALSDSQVTNRGSISVLNEQLQRKDDELQKERQKNQGTGLESLLIAAAREGNFVNVNNLLNLNGNLKIDVNCKNSEGYSPLLQAALSGNKDVINLLLVNQADLHATDASGYSILDHVALHAMSEILTFLIDKMSQLALFPHLVQAWHACQSKTPAELYLPIRLILSNSMLRCAVKQGNLPNVRSAVETYGANINFQDHYNETALHNACYYSHVEIAEFLLAADARTDIEDHHHQKPDEVIGAGEQNDTILSLFKFYALLHLVVSGKLDPVRQYLLSHPELLLGKLATDKQEQLFTAALNLPPSNERVDIIRTLFNVPVADGQKEQAARHLSLQCTYVGNEHGKKDTMPLHMAVYKNDRKIVKLLLMLGASNNDKVNEMTALEFARSLGHTGLADSIVAKSATEKYKRRIASCTLFSNGSDAAAAAAQAALSDNSTEIRLPFESGI